MDFSSKVSGVDDAQPPILTFHPAQPMATGHAVGQLYADGSVGITVKVGDKVWIPYVIPLHMRELCYKLDQATGLVPVGLESRITNSVVITSF